MTHADIEALVKQFLVHTATQGTPDARVQQVVVRLTTDLFKAIEDLDLSATEVWKGIEYFAEAGATHELACWPPAWVWSDSGHPRRRGRSPRRPDRRHAAHDRRPAVCGRRA
jgi:catechol 1,2-dioxygenase